MMRKKLEQKYTEIGINIETNKTLTQYLACAEFAQKELSQQYELFHMDLILGLLEIKKSDKISFKRYVKALNDSGAKINFWGEKFEIYMHHKLLKGVPKIITNLRRGKDGLEPDLVFNYKEKELGLELTTLKFITPPKNETQILSKITETIIQKNNKQYSKQTCGLIIDITNIIAYEKLFNFKTHHIFDKQFLGFSYLGKEMKFGMIILVNSIYISQNNNIKHLLNPYFGFKGEAKNSESNLMDFLNIFFNRFKPICDYEKVFNHINI